jgi:hypothetical protein
VTVHIYIDRIDGPNHEVEEDDPGGFIALQGPRGRLFLGATPGTGPLALETTAAGDKVEIHVAATGGNPLTGDDLQWDTTAEMPSELRLQATGASGGPQGVSASLNYEGRTTVNTGGHTDVVKITVIGIDMITPAGDPVNAAKQSGDGQNEFTYSAASPAVLTMNLKAGVTPSGVATQIKDQCG